MIRTTLRFKLMTVGMAAALIPMLVVGLMAVRKTSATLETLSRDQSLVVARNLAETVNILLTDEMKLASAMATNPSITLAATQVQILGADKSISSIMSVYDFLNAAMKRMGGNYENIVVSGPDGAIYADGSQKGIYKNQSIADQACFQNGIKGSDYLGGLMKSPVSGKLVFPVAVPVYSNTQELAGVLVIYLKEEYIADRISQVKIGKSGYPFMIDRSGLVLVHPNKEFVAKTNLTDIKGMETIARQMTSGGSGTASYYAMGEEYVSSYAPVPATGWSIGTSQIRSEALAAASSIRNSMLVVMLLALSATLGAMIWLARSILVPIKDAVSGLRDIAEGEGDLTMRLSMHNRDEIGELAHWFNIFIEKLQGIIRKLSDNSKQMEENAGSLLNIAIHFTRNAEQSSEQANGVTSAAEQMSSHLGGIAGAMEEVSRNTGMVASAAEEMSATISEISKNAENGRMISEKAARQTAEASERMAQLNQASQEIGKVTETINEISEQTNLLALNATIEAARAGEAGKGFAVVANEIKELARQTASATQDIKNKIDEMQNATLTTVSSMQEITGIINDTKDIVSTIASAVEEQSATTREIAGNISQTSKVIVDTNSNISECSKESAAISDHIQQVTLAAGEISSSSSQVKMSADDLKKIAANQSEIVSRFKI